ncbi:MAG: thiamine phosphate synthase [Paracoccaceae bacterium]
MPASDPVQIYLATPPAFTLSDFAGTLVDVLSKTPIACLRLGLASTDASELGRAADQLREICHARDVAIVIEDHYRLVKPHGLDGVHLTSGAQHIRDVRRELGADAIIGAYCGNSRHNGMTAGEIGADYISFGPISDNALGDGTIAPVELFQWWSEMIEIPVVAEGNLTPATIAAIKDHIDFLTVGPEIWNAAEGPVLALETLMNSLQ